MMLRFGLAIAAGLVGSAGAQAAAVPQPSSLVQQVQYYGGYGRDYDGDRDWRRDEWRQRRWREEQARREEWRRRENWRRYHRGYDDDE